MAGTEFPLNHPLAVQVWSNSLAVESGKRQYFSKFMGTGESALIVVKTELQKQAGEKITVGLRMKLREDGVEGDNLIEGTSAEEALTFFSDSLFIDQKRKGTKSKGKCPSCGQENMAYQNGCLTCMSCGYSKCG